jgi:hypothetical protein
LLKAFRQIGVVPPSVAVDLGANIDALFEGEGGSLSSTVILNYAYGIAAYKCWRSNRGIVDVMDVYRQQNYAHIHTPEPDYSNDYNSDSDPDESWTPDNSPQIWRRRKVESVLVNTMDELNAFFMGINGITPEEANKRREKDIEQEERAAQEASRIKVMKWRVRTSHETYSSSLPIVNVFIIIVYRYCTLYCINGFSSCGPGILVTVNRTGSASQRRWPSSRLRGCTTGN